jgi:predicted permease
MVWSTFAGFALALTHPPLPEWLTVAVKLTGDALIPMMLLSLGARLADVRWDAVRLGIVGGIACPATGLAMALLLAPVLGLDPTQRGLLILFGVLPPAVLNFMVAEAFRQEPHKVASIVLIGNVLSVLFVPVGLTLALG